MKTVYQLEKMIENYYWRGWMFMISWDQVQEGIADCRRQIAELTKSSTPVRDNYR